MKGCFCHLNGFEVKDAVAREKSEEHAAAIAAVTKYANPKVFGAAGDGVTDDTEAFQKAIDTGLPVIVPFESGNVYKIDGVLNFTKASAAFITGDFLPWRSGALIFGEGAYINADCEYFTMKNIRAVYNGGSQTNLGEKAVYVHNTESPLNADAFFQNCIFTHFDNCVDLIGRGLMVEGCTFTFSNNGILINYVGEGDSGVTTTDNIGGARGHVIRGNRFHGMFASCARTVAGSAVTGFVFNDNMCDIGNGGVQFDGAVYSAEICNNVLNFSNTAPIKILAQAEHITIDGNVLYCNNPKHSKDYPTNLIYVGGDGPFRASAITNNRLYGSSGSAIRLAQTTYAENCIFSKNIFEEVCKNGTYADAPICAHKGMVNCIVSDNQFLTTPDEGYCVRTDATDFTAKGNIIIGNIKNNENTTLALSSFDTNQRFVQEY